MIAARHHVTFLPGLLVVGKSPGFQWGKNKDQKNDERNQGILEKGIKQTDKNFKVDIRCWKRNFFQHEKNKQNDWNKLKEKKRVKKIES